LEERLESALVVGMTLDAYIGRLRDVPLHFEHVFLDEAAYAPVIKALTLFRQGVPVTFLGDHKQLPPVCEMNDEDFSLPQYCRVSIWKKSAMFCDALFSRSEEDFLSSCLNTDDPPFSFIRQVTLTETHRFGETLTRILSRAVYDGLPLQSVAPHGDLKITVVDAPLRQPPAEKRKNSAESAAIGRYLDTTLRAVDARDESAYAILTPYLNQVATINSSLPVARREQRVLTVHKSQGREWEVVVLSVVDGPWNTPWFTNSQRPESLRVLNTAVSRARQSLVIVCNLDFWEQQHPDQLITQLIQDATVADASESIR
jgi:hypothetical protein